MSSSGLRNLLTPWHPPFAATPASWAHCLQCSTAALRFGWHASRNLKSEGGPACSSSMAWYLVHLEYTQAMQCAVPSKYTPESMGTISSAEVYDEALCIVNRTDKKSIARHVTVLTTGLLNCRLHACVHCIVPREQWLDTGART